MNQEYHDPRTTLIDSASDQSVLWDVIVIGGGASGLSAAWDAVSRGLRVALLEQHDFAKATSSRSTKLVHGGVRYLQKLELGLVREALHERHLLLENAPEFCHPLRFVLPSERCLERYYYRAGLTLYDLLGSSSNVETSTLHNAKAVRELLPTLKMKQLRGGVSYSDAQFDDAGMAIALAQVINASPDGQGLALNYVKVDRLESNNGKISILHAQDAETGATWKMRAKVFINATGIFTDSFRDKQGIEKKWSLQMSRGSHIVVPGSVLASKQALIIPKTSDGRVLFAIPWMNHTIIGTTDVATDEALSEPTVSQQEIQFLLEEAGRYLGVEKSDILSQWAGLRPLVCKANKATKSLSRKHVIELSDNGLVSILGGKWTTARAMAEDAIDIALKAHKLEAKPSQTATRKLAEYGALPPLNQDDSGDNNIEKAISNYYTRTPEDYLARRKRKLFLNAQEAIDQTDETSASMAKILGWSDEKQRQSAEQFKALSQNYLP